MEPLTYQDLREHPDELHRILRAARRQRSETIASLLAGLGARLRAKLAPHPRIGRALARMG